VNKIRKMLSVVKDKMFDWKTERLEKQVAQLQKKTEKLVHGISEAVKDNPSEITLKKQDYDPKVQRPSGINE